MSDVIILRKAKKDLENEILFFIQEKISKFKKDTQFDVIDINIDIKRIYKISGEDEFIVTGCSLYLGI